MKKLSRRFFFNLSAFAAAPFVVPALDSDRKKYRIVHQVYFYFNNPGNEAEINSVIEGLKKLRAIKQIQKLEIGRPASTLKRDVVDNSYDLSETMYFASPADQDAYQIHPLHQEFVSMYSGLWKTVKVFDTELID